MLEQLWFGWLGPVTHIFGLKTWDHISLLSPALASKVRPMRPLQTSTSNLNHKTWFIASIMQHWNAWAAVVVSIWSCHSHTWTEKWGGHKWSLPPLKVKRVSMETLAVRDIQSQPCNMTCHIHNATLKCLSSCGCVHMVLSLTYLDWKVGRS